MPEQLNTEPTPGQCRSPSCLRARVGVSVDRASRVGATGDKLQRASCEWDARTAHCVDRISSTCAAVQQDLTWQRVLLQFFLFFFTLNVHTCSTFWSRAPANMCCVVCFVYSELVQMTLQNASAYVYYVFSICFLYSSLIVRALIQNPGQPQSWPGWKWHEKKGL